MKRISSVCALMFLGFAGYAYSNPSLLSNWPFHAPQVTSESLVSNPDSGDIVFNTTISKYLGFNGTSWTEFGGGNTASSAIVVKSAAYTLDSSADDIVLANASAGAFTLSLPAATSSHGKNYIVKKTDSNNANAVTIDPNSTETIDGAATTTINTGNEVIHIVSDGSGWQILNRNYPQGWVSAGTVTIHATTTNPTKGAAQTVDTVYWRRVGDSAEIRMDFRQSSATGANAGSGDYLFKIPASIGTIDTSKVNFYSTVEGWNSFHQNAFVVGSGAFHDGTNDGVGVVVAYDSSSVRLFGNIASAQAGSIASNGFALTSANVQYSLNFKVPISGWKD